MERSKYWPRIIDRQISEYLSTFGAVCIEGPKWCGKTWSARFHSSSEVLIGDPHNNFQNRKLAELSPSLVLEGDAPRLIDEWQEVPTIWDAVRYEVDRRGEPGQFLLTGSATPNHKGIMHSGAGRIARLRMHPMSLFESRDSSGKVSLRALLDGAISPVVTGEVELVKLLHLIVRGGWPAGIGRSPQSAPLLAKQYIDAVLEDDIFRMDGVPRDSKKMRLLLRSLARNESTTVSNRKLQQDIRERDEEALHVNTVAEYLDIFERLFLTANLPPFATKVRSALRVKQSEKRRFVDPSLACSLLNLTPEALWNDLETAGFLFESLCSRDLKIYAESIGGTLYHYRDYEGNEIDAVIEMPSGDWYAFEIKLGANQIDSAAETLLKLRNRIAMDRDGRPPKRLFVICGLSNAVYQREDGVVVVPITALRD
ncbi:MAG: DUF4143 domain-containing protein [Bacillota bacterium]|nr:DUF4143 domain-containing protein [Bacillota bacterium]